MHLDIDRILCKTFVARVEYLPSVGSTNDRAAECATHDEGKLPLLVVADRQTAGRGRGANRWWTGPGALAFSLAVDARTVNAEHGPAPLVARASAVAVAETVAPLLPDHPVRIHWPNDIMAADRKLAGILIEALPDRRHIIGIGLNTNNTLADAPAELQATAATLRDLAGHEFDQTTILIDLLNHLECEFARLCLSSS
jgi:BirA family transcriptional regulator, biotin operon repressor / biotin---[acetyl-CoA-carboxylase] ligase